MFKSKGQPLLDIYAMFWHATRAYPTVKDAAGKVLKGKSPETFAALMSIDDINGNTLHKNQKYATPDQHLFYSRSWTSDSGRSAGKQYQAGEIKFDYPLTAIEADDFSPRIRKAQNNLRFSFFVMDQHPGKVTYSNADSYANNRTFEELEADLTTIFTHVVRHVLRDWSLYLLPDGFMYWSGKKSVDMPAGAKLKFKLSDGLAVDDIRGRFFRNAGSDVVAGVQSYFDLTMPELICYTSTGSGDRIEFLYPEEQVEPRQPEGHPGQQVFETPSE